MRVFITGGTGLIGSALVDTLISRQYRVFALARSETACTRLRAVGAVPIHGDLTDPARWCATLPPVDAVIHAACDFSDAMTDIDRTLLDHLIPAMHAMPGPVRFLYTGGSWLFAQTPPGQSIDEGSPFDPLPEFQWMCSGIDRVLGDERLHGIVIHPGCVYATGRHGHYGLLGRDLNTARTKGRVTLIGDGDVTLPMVHADDLAELYCLALGNATPGSSYFGVAINDLTNRALAGLIARHVGTPDCQIDAITVQTAMTRLGCWAAGLARHQTMTATRAVTDLGWNPAHCDIENDLPRIGMQFRD
ncbi:MULTISPECIES: NAD-dependent epimerase/dehydratase family protein [unclassified Thalassospira]|uniref:NAD-dependent epimerase/dehydratase family protein n=1 Tax=unclassified Thalassospira TaxID=2648997 RepID=UPI001B283156|nr:NAD-dependent epimerase/dehydratase family protein [Thalassospira sp.]MBO6772261.1 NAD-dependent epimerase/dehydratase family protein [Thalassospira sp.]